MCCRTGLCDFPLFHFFLLPLLVYLMLCSGQFKVSLLEFAQRLEVHFQPSTSVNVLRGINDLSLQMPGDEPELFDDLLLGDWATYGEFDAATCSCILWFYDLQDEKTWADTPLRHRTLRWLAKSCG